MLIRVNIPQAAFDQNCGTMGTDSPVNSRV
jgi:hypothetical protein